MWDKEKKKELKVECLWLRDSLTGDVHKLEAGPDQSSSWFSLVSTGQNRFVSR